MSNFDTLDNQSTLDDGDYQGKLLANRYRIIRKLGEGGMGMVYLAEDTELSTQVAVKFVPPMLAGSARAIKNLKREATMAMQLSHPNIVRLHDLHTDGHQKFLVMEYIEGKTLDDALAENESERMTLPEALPVMEQITAGLDYAHSKQVLHRDLKPSNIIVGTDGSVKLLDFGIAREIKDSYTRITGNLTSGTLPYMSPEQLMGERPTIAMDVYSLGAVLYECLAGHPPFHTGDIRRQIEVKVPENIEFLPDFVNQVLLDVLAKDATKRPCSASELMKALKGIPSQGIKPPPPPPPLSSPSITAPSDSPVSQSTVGEKLSAAPTFKKTNWGLWLLFILVVLVLGLGMGYWGPGLILGMIVLGVYSSIKSWGLGLKLIPVAGMWGVGMGLGLAIWWELDESSVPLVVSVPALAAFWGLWCGLIIGVTLKLMKRLHKKRNVFILSLGWGSIWSLAGAAIYILGETFDSVLAVILATFLGFIATEVTVLWVLRREGTMLTKPRQVLLGLGWLIVVGIHCVIWAFMGDYFDHKMSMNNQEAYPLAAGLGGMVLGYLGTLMTCLIVNKQEGEVET